MKKGLFSFFILSFGILLFNFTACKKSADENTKDDHIPKNAAVTISGKNGITITATDVYSKKSSFKREILINNEAIGTSFPLIHMTFVSDDNDNIYEKIRNTPNLVNGVFTIEINEEIVLRKKIINGKGLKSELVKAKQGAVTDMNQAVPCTVTTVHDCVAWEIDDMNWIEYAACLISAPACYAELWASCTCEVCHNGKRYVNPNN